MNRISSYLEEAEEPQEPHVAASYFVVETSQYWFIVGRDTAERIERQLDRWWGRRWITFRDLNGARRRVPRAAIDLITESTPAQRAAARAWRRARKLEDRADRRPWEDDE